MGTYVRQPQVGHCSGHPPVAGARGASQDGHRRVILTPRKRRRRTVSCRGSPREMPPSPFCEQAMRLPLLRRRGGCSAWGTTCTPPRSYLTRQESAPPVCTFVMPTLGPWRGMGFGPDLFALCFLSEGASLGGEWPSPEPQGPTRVTGGLRSGDAGAQVRGSSPWLTIHCIPCVIRLRYGTLPLSFPGQHAREDQERSGRWEAGRGC